MSTETLISSLRFQHHQHNPKTPTTSQSSLWGPLDNIPIIGNLWASSTNLCGQAINTTNPAATIQVIGSVSTTKRTQSGASIFRRSTPVEREEDVEAILTTSTSPHGKMAYKRWISVSSMRKKAKQAELPYPSIDTILSGNAYGDSVEDDRKSMKSIGYKTVGTQSSSMKYVSEIRSATISLVTFSQESTTVKNDETGPPYDGAMLERMKCRRGLVQELLTTEEGYISDLRSLLAMHHHILGEGGCLAPKLEGVRRTIQTLLDFHDRFLKHLLMLFPVSCRMVQGTQCASAERPQEIIGHILASTPAVAGVADVFDRMIKELYIYEEYAAQHGLIAAEFEERKGKLQPWRLLEKGCEALTNSTIPNYSATMEQGRRGATLGDLAMKPIQRICRYSLLLEQMLQVTPSKDDPNANRQLECVLHRLKDATTAIDQASNREVFPKMQKTWILQRRLILNSDVPFRFRLLGRNLMCGVLYVIWQERDSVQGHYMVCLLYKQYLLLCTVTHGPLPRYKVLFAIALAFARVEDVSNCTQMEITTSSHSFRLAFTYNRNSYEVILTACNAEEEAKWRNKIEKRSREACKEYFDYDSTFPSIPNPIPPGLQAIPHFFSSARHRASLSKSTTYLASISLPPTCMVQVAVLNTTARVYNSSRSPQLPTRSASASSTEVTILAPCPSIRTTLENFLADVYSREALPIGLMEKPRTGTARRFSVRSLSSLHSIPGFSREDRECRKMSPISRSSSVARSVSSWEVVSTSSSSPCSDISLAPTTPTEVTSSTLFPTDLSTPKTPLPLQSFFPSFPKRTKSAPQLPKTQTSPPPATGEAARIGTREDGAEKATAWVNGEKKKSVGKGVGGALSMVKRMFRHDSGKAKELKEGRSR